MKVFNFCGCHTHERHCNGFTKSDWFDDCISSWPKAYHFATYAVQNYQSRVLYTTSGTLDGRSYVDHQPIQIRWTDDLGLVSSPTGSHTTTTGSSGSDTPAFTPASSQPTSPSETAGSAPDATTSSTGLSTGAKAGIGVGTALGAIILILAALLFRRRRSRSKGAKASDGSLPDQPELHDDDIKELPAGPGTLHRNELAADGLPQDAYKTPELDAAAPKRAVAELEGPGGGGPAHPELRTDRREPSVAELGVETPRTYVDPSTHRGHFEETSSSPHHALSRAGPVATHLPTDPGEETAAAPPDAVELEIRRLEAEEERIRSLKEKLQDSRTQGSF